MEHAYLDRLRTLGLFEARVPRYTSYPTAAVFTPDVGEVFQNDALARLTPDEAVSVYVHVPFCERLCWFCACHTQGTKTLAPVERYIEAVEAELRLLRKKLPAGVRMAHLHWGGGTPTILPPHLIHRLAKAVRGTFAPLADYEFSVEIDPTMVDRDKIAALAAEGMTRASIGIQDFDPEVQEAIGRAQPYDVTAACVSDLRAAGIASLNADLVYGLPHQTEARLRDTVDKVLTFAPERIALFGYAHVPWASKRQKLIKEDTLPGDEMRYGLATLAAERFTGAGFTPIGIDHFAIDGDALQQAAQAGTLRRNFQGYTADDCPTLIGVGASSISRMPDGYVQNAPATAAYLQRIADGRLAGARGYELSVDDAVRARAIEMLMCAFRVDLDVLEQEFPGARAALGPDLFKIAARFGTMVDLSDGGLDLLPEGRPLTRIAASHLDAHLTGGQRYSRAS